MDQHLEGILWVSLTPGSGGRGSLGHYHLFPLFVCLFTPSLFMLNFFSAITASAPPRLILTLFKCCNQHNILSIWPKWTRWSYVISEPVMVMMDHYLEWLWSGWASHQWRRRWLDQYQLSLVMFFPPHQFPWCIRLKGAFRCQAMRNSIM